MSTQASAKETKTDVCKYWKENNKKIYSHNNY